jgi:hypothetical protein
MLKRKHINDINRARSSLIELGEQIAEQAYVTDDPDEAYRLGKLDEVRDRAEDALAHVIVTAKTHNLGDVTHKDVVNEKE